MTRKSERNTTNTASTGNMPMNLKNKSNNTEPEALEAGPADSVLPVTARTGILPTVKKVSEMPEDSAVMPEDSLISSKNCSDIVEREPAADEVPDSGDRIIMPNCNWSLREAAVTHKQVLNVNGKNIRITVPAGIANGQTIKLRGHGAPGVNGGPDGDLYITFIIPDDPVFKRLGNDLYVTAPLNLYTAVLGGEETVDTLDGKVKLKVKPETQNGTKVRLKGKGFPVYKEEGKFGDLIVTYNITIPTNLTEHQKELFRQLKNSIN